MIDIAQIIKANQGRPHLQRQGLTYKGSQHTGAVIALFVSDEIARQIAIPDGEDAAELHVTLVYLGEAADIEDPGAIHDLLRYIAQEYAPLTGTVNGTARFCTEGGDQDDVFVLLPDVPTLPEFRQRIVGELTAKGVDHSRDHGFIPHITLKYLPKHQELPFTEHERLPLEFATVSLVMAGQRTDYPLAGVRSLTEKAGARHTKREFETIQRMHDMAVGLGAVCKGYSENDGKVRKAQIDAPNYRPASTIRRCDNCEHFHRDTWCEQYDFVADLDYVCDGYEQRPVSGLVNGGGIIQLSQAIAKNRLDRPGLIEKESNDANTPS